MIGFPRQDTRCSFLLPSVSTVEAKRTNPRYSIKSNIRLKNLNVLFIYIYFILLLFSPRSHSGTQSSSAAHNPKDKILRTEKVKRAEEAEQKLKYMTKSGNFVHIVCRAAIIYQLFY